MSTTIEEFLTEISRVLGQNAAFAALRVTRAAKSRKDGMVVIHIDTDEYFPPAMFRDLSAYLNEQLSAFRIPLRPCVHQPGGILDDEKQLSRTAKEYLCAFCPPSEPYVCESRVSMEDGALHFEFTKKMAPLLMTELQIIDKLCDYLNKSYDKSYHVGRLLYLEKVESDDGFKPPKRRRSSVKQKPAAEIKKAGAAPRDTDAPPPPVPPPVQPEPPREEQRVEIPKDDNMLFGKTFTMRPSPIAQVEPIGEEELMEYKRRRMRRPQWVIEGEIIATETRVTSGDKFTIVNFALTDYESSMRCKLFLKGNCEAEAANLKTGIAVRVKGSYEWDSFLKDNIFNATDIMKAKKKERVDESEEKRVELHMHTTMSTQDGMTSASDYIARAAKWGMKAVAITDHGVVQAYPEAAGAGAKYGVKIIYGIEGYLIDDERPVTSAAESFDDEFVVFDIETTGLSPIYCGITEIGAVRVKNGEILEEFGTFVNPGMPIPPDIMTLTGITNDMVADAPDTAAALKLFWEFAGDACLVAHNADFDTSFVFGASRKLGYPCSNAVLDTLALARAHLTGMKRFKLNILAKHYGVPLVHHRAVNDARATAQIMLKMFAEMRADGMEGLADINRSSAQALKTERSYHIILLCKDRTGMNNLFRLVSAAHLQHFYHKPRMPRRLIEKYREGLIIGSACSEGELFSAMMNNASDETVRRIGEFYDYFEIQPDGNNEYLIREGRARDREMLHDIDRRIIELGRSMGKMTVATTDSHFLDPRDEVYRRVMMTTMGFKDAAQQAPLYFRTTDEMLGEFDWLGEDTAREVVIDNTNAIAEMIGEIQLFPKDTAMPYVEGCEDYISDLAYSNIKKKYGEPLPEMIAERLEKELSNVIKHGFAVLYYAAQKLVKKSNDDGYLVGSRGSVGSSLLAYALGITEVNPLKPHYRCPKCTHADFDVDSEQYGCGVDLPAANCPVCGAKYDQDGYDIPFEVFLGFNADKVPDIDLNFSGEYQPRAHKYTEELFGSDFVFRAGTIGTIQEKTALGYVKKYEEIEGLEIGRAEELRLAQGIAGTKKTTGQHPGGLVIVPRDREIYEFTPVQKPADKSEADSITTHFDFNSMHDVLIKLDILGHDVPTAIRMLEDITDIKPMEIPLNDPETMELFTSTRPLGVVPEQIRGVKVGTLGVPEFGTPFTLQMLCDTKPTTMAELIRISGLSHGTDVWVGNAKDLVLSGTATLKEAVCTRDDIMNHLIYKGVEPLMAFKTMESVRKGKWAKGKEKDQQKQEDAMRAANVEDWFIESCRKIQYMFPKAHAAAYVIMSLRLAYCKVHYPAEFYATHFTLNADAFDASYFLKGSEHMKAAIDEIESKGDKSTAVEDRMSNLLLLGVEMFARGIGFLPIDLHKSQPRRFGVEGGNLRPPFLAIPKLGEKAAEALYTLMHSGEDVSIEDIKKTAKVSSTVVDIMREMGCLDGIPETSQLSLFDL